MTQIFKTKRALHFSLLGYWFGNVFRVSTVTALNNLQTSLNVKAGLGEVCLFSLKKMCVRN